MSEEIRAYSFQSDLTFEDAKKLLIPEVEGAGAFGEWYERDSAWYTNLLSCRSHPGLRMNLYFFDAENILELKLTQVDRRRVAEAEAFALGTILPALGARDVKPTDSVD